VWKQLESGRVVHRFDPLVIVATLALVPVLIIETDAKSARWQDVATAANWVIWAVFLVELAFVLRVAPRKGAALRAHWLDTTIVVLTVPAFGSFLSSLRLARLARLLRLLRLGAILGRALQRERAMSSDVVFRFVGLLTALIVVVGGAAEALFDRRDVPTIWDGIWWSVVTVTTVGYGDFYPRTVGGRIIAMAVMLAGIGFLSVLTATIASRFVRTDTGTDEVMATLTRIEAELAELKRRLA
jgi:voltage-gated potassium channel